MELDIPLILTVLGACVATGLLFGLRSNSNRASDGLSLPSAQSPLPLSFWLRECFPIGRRRRVRLGARPSAAMAAPISIAALVDRPAQSARLQASEVAQQEAPQVARQTGRQALRVANRLVSAILPVTTVLAVILVLADLPLEALLVWVGGLMGQPLVRLLVTLPQAWALDRQDRAWERDWEARQ